MGHPRIFINVDKPQVCMCTYCGLPFVSFLFGFYRLGIDSSRPTSTTESILSPWTRHILWNLKAMPQRSMSRKELPMRLLGKDRGPDSELGIRKWNAVHMSTRGELRQLAVSGTLSYYFREYGHRKSDHTVRRR